MIWLGRKHSDPRLWCKQTLAHPELTPEVFKQYRVKIGTQIFEDYTKEFQTVYDKERTWERLGS